MSETSLHIAWIGLGKMGTAMAGRLRRAGYAIAVHNRTPAKAVPLVEQGARAADSPRGAASGADVVFTMIADDPALEAVTLGEGGALAGMRAGSILIDMSTVSPRASARVAEAAAEAGVAYLRAPVSGSTQFAEAGRLTIFASGPRPAFETATPPFQQLGQQVYYVGAAEEARRARSAARRPSRGSARSPRHASTTAAAAARARSASAHRGQGESEVKRQALYPDSN